MLIRMDYDSIKIIEKKISYYQRPDESKQFSILKIIAPSCGNLLSAISSFPIILKRVTTAP